MSENNEDDRSYQLKICHSASAMSTFWQIYVTTDKSETVAATVLEDCFTAELFDKIRDRLSLGTTEEFILYFNGSAVEYSRTKRLSYYSVKDKSTLAMVVRVRGGMQLTERDLEEQPRHLRPGNGITITENQPDILGLDDDSPRALMPCGHAIAPLSLAKHCFYKLREGNTQIQCPSSGCGQDWPLSPVIQQAACLTTTELNEFQLLADKNYSRRSSQWHSDTGSSAVNAVLSNCGTVELNGVWGPAVRACPMCRTLIQRTEDCKHITCSRCLYSFCFICLNKNPCKTGYYQPCTLAPRQSTYNYSTPAVEKEEVEKKEVEKKEVEKKEVEKESAWCSMM